jgi:hypothetical protein
LEKSSHGAPMKCRNSGVLLHGGASKGRDAVTIYDYAAMGTLIILAVGAAAELIPHDKFKL